MQKVNGLEDHPDYHNPVLIRKRFAYHPLAPSLQQHEERKAHGTLDRRADVEGPLMNASAAHMMWNLDRGVANLPDAAVVSDATVNNDANIFYLNFYPDLSCAFKTAELVDSQPAAYLGSSTTTDLLTLMHNRT